VPGVEAAGLGTRSRRCVAGQGELLQTRRLPGCAPLPTAAHELSAINRVIDHAGPAESQDQPNPDRFDDLDEYELAHLVTHLCESMDDYALDPNHLRHASQAIRWLVALLGDPGFPLAKARRMDARATVNDYVIAHDVISRDGPDIAHDLSQALAAAAIVDSAGPDPRLPPDVLHALLAYRADTAMYSTLLKMAIEGDLIDRLVSDTASRAWILGAFLQAAATRYRRLGGVNNLELSRTLLVKATASVKGAAVTCVMGKARTEELRSSVLYDRAYLDYLTGRVRAAQDGFRRSARAASRAGDLTRYYISSILELLIGFYAGATDASALGDLLREALVHFTAASKNSSHAQRWVMNTRAHLFDLCCLVRDVPGADEQLGALQADPWVAAYHPLDLVILWEARYSLLLEDGRRACELFEAVLHDVLPEAESSSREGTARDLLDYGTALMAAGREDQARLVWEQGLRCPDYAGNWPWKPNIRERLRSLGAPRRAGP
jgi:hypothetical protein